MSSSGPPDYFFIQTKPKIRSYDNYDKCHYCGYIYHIDDITCCSDCCITGCKKCINLIECETNEETKKISLEYQKYMDEYRLPPLVIYNTDDCYDEFFCPDCWVKEFDENDE